MATDTTHPATPLPVDQDDDIVAAFSQGMSSALSTAESSLAQTTYEKVEIAMRRIFDHQHEDIHAKRMELGRLTELADHNETDLHAWRRTSIEFANAMNGQAPPEAEDVAPAGA